MAKGYRIKTVLYILCLLQGVSMILSWVFIHIGALIHKGKDRMSYATLSVFNLFLGGLMTCGSSIALKVDKDRKAEQRDIAVFVWTVALLSLNYLCQIGLFARTVIKWNVMDILAAIFDCVNIIAGLATIAVVLHNPKCSNNEPRRPMCEQERVVVTQKGTKLISLKW